MDYKSYFEESVKRNAVRYNSWQFPSDKNLRQEYDIEYQKHLKPQYGDFWPTFDDFMKAAEDGKVIEIGPSTDATIGSRSRTRNKEDLIGLLSSYRSWGKFRNEQTTQNLYDRINKNLPLDMPLILKTKYGMKIMSGNTRADVAMQTIGSYEALILDVSDRV